MTQADEIRFENMTPSHLDGAARLSAAEAWPHRAEDWALLLSVSKGVVALGPTDGAVIATACVTPFGPAALANMIIVGKNWRRHGLGRAVMERAMARIAPPPSEWRLVATSDGLPLYERLGFRETGRIFQHQGPLRLAEPGGAAGVRWATNADLPALPAMDGAATGLDRASLLERLAACGRIAVLEQGGAVTGYAALRPFGRGEVAGPVIARDAEAAKRLLRFLFAEREGAFLRVDTPEASGLAPWLAERGLAHAGGGVTMRRGEAPAPAAETGYRMFALAAQALG